MINEYLPTLANSKPPADFLDRYGIPSGLYDDVAAIFTGPLITYANGLPVFVAGSVASTRAYGLVELDYLRIQETYRHALARMGIDPWVDPERTVRYIADMLGYMAYTYRQSADDRSLTARPARV